MVYPHAMPLSLATPIDHLPSVGPVYVKRLAKLGIATIEDLITHFPFRYDDFSLISPINRLRMGEVVTVQGTIASIAPLVTKRGKRMQKAVVSDATGSVGVIWFNQPYLVNALPVGSTVSLAGKVSFFGREKVLESPEYELLATKGQPFCGCIHTGRLVPVYPETYGLSSKWLRTRIFFLLSQLESQLIEYLPGSIINYNQLTAYAHAICAIHFPQSKDEEIKARNRLGFDELFLTQLASFIRRREWHRETVGKKLQITNYKLQITNFINTLPFTLTGAQKRCLDEILKDLGSTHPMNRLLQGDVGSGKTVVAAIAMYVAHLNSFQSIFMAPTELLARQHFNTLGHMLSPLGISVALKTASNKKDVHLKADILVGTHALLFEQNAFTRVGLVVIDEQHRFGVRQRSELTGKGMHPHLLSMTATPIPRSVALTLYGELDLSYIDEMPHGRKMVKTWLVPNEKRGKAYQWMTKEIAVNQSQTFIICPLIEESEHETLQSVKSATVEYERLKKIFPDIRLGLLHGRMKSKEKDTVLEQFRNNKLAILVATPVVEVGIDVPNAAIILIEAAERFGLAQLHQLRGRVGRGEKQSYCLLFTESANPFTLKRVASLETIFNGAALAELDLSLRGAGELYGIRQHGFTSFKIASLSDTALIARARAAASFAIDHGHNASPLLQEKLKKYTIQTISPN